MRSQSRGWIGFFVVLAVLAVTAITILWVFNWRQQLKPQELADARARWNKQGPRDYNLKYQEQGSISGAYEVRVRNGKVVYAEPDERLLAQKRAYYGMEALFDFVEDFLKHDAQPNMPRTFAVASFDPEDGHLIHYIRSVTGTGERLELDVHFERVSEETPPSPKPGTAVTRTETTSPATSVGP